MAVITYSDKVKINLEPTTVTESNRKGLHGRIPVRPYYANLSCLSCGLKQALQLTSDSSSVLTVIIVIRSRNSDIDINSLSKVAENSTASIFDVIVGETSVMPLKCAKFFSIDDNKAEIQTQLYDVFNTITNQVSSESDNVTKFCEKELQLVPNKTYGSNFTVEESLRSHLRVIINTEDLEHIEFVILTSPSGREFKFPLIERGSIFFNFLSQSEAGVWRYKIGVASVVTDNVTVSVSCYASDNNMKLSSWTEFGDESENVIDAVVTPLKPMIIYAELKLKNLPVVDAEIVAEIMKPTGETVDIILSDAGTGYPDITRGDGIYSGYFTSYSHQMGLYAVKIKASDNSGKCQVPTTGSGQVEDCCGSFYPAASSFPTPSFSRVLTASSFYVAKGAQLFIEGGMPKVKDIFPPIRITDLKIFKNKENSSEIILNWSVSKGSSKTFCLNLKLCNTM